MTVSKLTKSTDVYEVQQKINEIIDSYPTVRGYLENGQSYTDTTLYKDVYGYNHSTFDVSKFTKVGSPIISADGVASGFTTSNYVKINYSLEKGKNYKFTYTYIGHINENASGSYCLLEMATNNPYTDDAIRMFQGTNNIIRFACGSLSDINTSITVTNNTVYNFIIETDFNTFIKVSETTTGYSHTATTTFARSTNGSYEIVLGCRISASAPLLLGSIDLKQFSITVNSYPTFSGNKTGIDTIKPADYTTVGAPTISADGVVSGFSASNYLTKITTISLDKTTYFEFDVKFTTPSSWTKNGRFWAYGTKLAFGHSAIGKLSGAFIGSSINQDSIRILATNTTYEAKFIYDTTGFYVKYKKLTDATWTSSTPATVTSTETQTLRGAIGNAYADTAAYFTGSIDLNSIKFYVNGNLVYQACLLIPYNESSTGSKIVDVAYRDRVIDVYNQFGSANYYTIDETNKNVTLPMGEVYGFIEQAKENFSVPAYGNQNIGVIITDNLTYTCPDDGFIYCYNIQVTAGGGFELSISRNGQSSSLISFGGISVDASVQIPFIYPVIKGDVAQILWSSTASTYPILYFVPKEGI